MERLVCILMVYRILFDLDTDIGLVWDIRADPPTTP
jgi:hypothetical protein